MLSWIIQISLISIIFIFLVHHLLTFFKSTLTVPKIKDLVNSPNQKYQHIYDTILDKSTNTNVGYTNVGYTNVELLPSDNLNNEITTMKDELKSFLKKQLNKNDMPEAIEFDRNFSNF
jgi:hypothetical protein